MHVLLYNTMRFVVITKSNDSPWLFGRVELDWNTYGRVDTVDSFPCADVSVQSVLVELTVVDRGGSRSVLPDPLQFVRERYRLTYSRLHNIQRHQSNAQTRNMARFSGSFLDHIFAHLQCSLPSYIFLSFSSSTAKQLIFKQLRVSVWRTLWTPQWIRAAYGRRISLCCISSQNLPVSALQIQLLQLLTS